MSVRPAVRVYGRTRFASREAKPLARARVRPLRLTSGQCWRERTGGRTAPRRPPVRPGWPSRNRSGRCRIAVTASVARCEPSPTRISSRKPFCISTTDCSTCPPSNSCAAPVARLASPEATAANWSARSRGRYSLAAMGSPSTDTSKRMRHPGNLAGELRHQPVQRAADDRAFIPDRVLDSVSRACARPVRTPPKWLLMEARTASGSRTAAACWGCRPARKYAVGCYPPTLSSWSALCGRAGHQPGSGCAHRQAVVRVGLDGLVLGLRRRRPAAIPHRLPIQVGALGQLVRVTHHLREHPPVDHVVIDWARRD